MMPGKIMGQNMDRMYLKDERAPIKRSENLRQFLSLLIQPSDERIIISKKRLKNKRDVFKFFLLFPDRPQNSLRCLYLYAKSSSFLIQEFRWSNFNNLLFQDQNVMRSIFQFLFWVSIMEAITFTQLLTIDSGTEYDVVVIGGGIAGTTAANFLTKKGYSVVIAEANAYLGGRLKTTEVGLSNGGIFNFDEGASWIHGYSNQNPLKAVSARVQGLKMFETIDDKTQVYDENGKSADNHTDQLEEKFESIVEEEAGEFDQSLSMEGAIEKIDSNLLVNKYFMYHIGTNLEFETSGTIDKLSAVWDDDSFDGSEQIIVSGYQRFPQTLASEEKLKVLLNHKVIKIAYNGQGNIITFENEHYIKSKFVVISVPLGVLQANKIEFSPALPQWKKEAINSIGFGNVCKILLTFQNMNFLKIYSHYIGVVSSDVNKRGFGTYFLNLKALANIPALMTFGLGPNADEAQNMPEAQLKNFLAKRLSTFSERQVSSNQFSIYRSSWRNNENVMGAYSFGSTETTPQAWKDMAEPIAENNWYFCGEHTISKYRGTVHGAYLSGKMTAERLYNEDDQ